jgi:hypothetical protein
MDRYIIPVCWCEDSYESVTAWLFVLEIVSGVYD